MKATLVTVAVVSIALLASCHPSGGGGTDTTGSTDTTATTQTVSTTAGDVAIKVRTPSADGRTSQSGSSFVSTDSLKFSCDGSEPSWTADGLDPNRGTGGQFSARVKAPPAPGGRTKALQYTVGVDTGGRHGSVRLIQDPIDVIRQQYIDMKKNHVLRRHDFVSHGGSANFTFADIQSRDRAKWAVFSAFPHLEEWRTEYGQPLQINRGFTTPRHNASVPGAAKNSQHLYGTAADVNSTDADWEEKRDAAKRAGACTEPLAISGSHHVHGDWRVDGCPPGW